MTLYILLVFFSDCTTADASLIVPGGDDEDEPEPEDGNF